jgi:hypothetical protein
MRNLVVRVPETADSLVIPQGFVTNLASIPPAFRSLISKSGPQNLPAIVHDYLYWTQICTRDEADVIFAKMLKETGTPWLERNAMYVAVANFGRRAWHENAAHRGEGLPRMVPADARPAGYDETWDEFQVYLLSRGESPLPSPIMSPGFCSYPRRAYDNSKARLR